MDALAELEGAVSGKRPMTAEQLATEASGKRPRAGSSAAQQAVATNSAQKPSFKPAPPLVSIKKVAAVKPKRESSPLPPFF